MSYRTKSPIYLNTHCISTVHESNLRHIAKRTDQIAWTHLIGSSVMFTTSLILHNVTLTIVGVIFWLFFLCMIPYYVSAKLGAKWTLQYITKDDVSDGD